MRGRVSEPINSELISTQKMHRRADSSKQVAVAIRLIIVVAATVVAVVAVRYLALSDIASARIALQVLDSPITLGILTAALILSAGLWAVGAFSNNYNQSINGKKWFTGSVVALAFYILLAIVRLPLLLQASPAISIALIGAIFFAAWLAVFAMGRFVRRRGRRSAINDDILVLIEGSQRLQEAILEEVRGNA